jgi:hypothetical protein
VNVIRDRLGDRRRPIRLDNHQRALTFAPVPKTAVQAGVLILDSGRSTKPCKEYLMKKLLLMSAVLVLAACGKKNEAPAAGETTGEMAPAAAPADTGMGMSHDSSSMAPSSDTMMTRDSAK